MPALYGWGSNVHGQLGQPIKNILFTKPIFVHDASAILASNGSQVFFRDNKKSLVLGYSESQSALEPQTVTFSGQLLGQDNAVASLKKCRICYDGTEYDAPCNMIWATAAVDLRGRVAAITGRSTAHLDQGVPWIFSSIRAWAQFNGTPDDEARILYESDTLSTVSCQRVAAGGAHFVFLASGHPCQVFATGDNRFGQLGDLEPSIEATTLCPVSFFSKNEAFPSSVNAVACGSRHTLVKTVDGDCYTWGLAPDGSIQPPSLIDLDYDIIAIACGAASMYFLDKDGNLFACGNSTFFILTQTSMAKSVRATKNPS